MVSSRADVDSSTDTAAVLRSADSPREKAALNARLGGTLATREVSRYQLDQLLRLIRLGCGRLGRGYGRLRPSGLRSRPGRRWSRYTRLRVVQVHHGLGHVHGLAPPHHRALRARLRCIHDDAESVIGSVLDEHRTKLLYDALRDFVLLVLRVFTRILQLTVKRLLLGLDLLHQIRLRVIVQLVLLRVELLLQSVDL